MNKGHGRIEKRTLEATPILTAGQKWKGLKQGLRITRGRTVKGVTSVEVVYGITRRTRVAADAAGLLALTRPHWSIEDGLHYVRDVTPGEDRCRVRKGNAPQVRASLRNVAVYLFNHVNAPGIAAATREVAACPEKAIPWLQHPTSTSE